MWSAKMALTESPVAGAEKTGAAKAMRMAAKADAQILFI
jgi:hypothetical protein